MQQFDRIHAEWPDNEALGRERRVARRQLFQDRADVLWNSGQEREALAFMETAARVWPMDVEIPLWQGPLAAVQGRLEDAARYAARAVSLAPEDPGVLFRAASTARLCEPASARQYVESLKDILDSRGPDFVFGLIDDLPNLEALLLWDEGHHRDAVVWFRHAFTLQPDNRFVAGDLAEALIHSGGAAEALQVIARVRETSPDDSRLTELHELASQQIES